MIIQTLQANRVVFGDWSRDTVRLDFDNTPLETVKYWAYWAMIYFHLDGFIILESSRRTRTFKKPNFHLVKTSYLVIFDRKVTWELNQKVMAWVSLRSHIEGLKNYLVMQIVKGSSTVRCGNKVKKPAPKVVFRYGRQDGQIAEFLETRQFILDALKGRLKTDLEKEEALLFAKYLRYEKDAWTPRITVLK